MQCALLNAAACFPNLAEVHLDVKADSSNRNQGDDETDTSDSEVYFDDDYEARREMQPKKAA